MKALLITEGNQDPRNNDDWRDSVMIQEDSDASIEELIELCDEEHRTEGCGIWLYDGDNYEDISSARRLSNGAVIYDMFFHPWDTDNVTLIRSADPGKDDDVDDSQLEVAMESGMLHGVNAYNDAMGY